jgi:hypothetical protein
LRFLASEAHNIKRSFDLASRSKLFWEAYAPQSGGRPTGDAVSWNEVGEHVLRAAILTNAHRFFNNVSFPGTPFGHDVRFLTDEAFDQNDNNTTGPNDEHAEVVSSPQQVSGEGRVVDGTIQNQSQFVCGRRRLATFQPKLPPFWVFDGVAYPVLTFYLKVIYEVLSRGEQPLVSLELVSVPNGLLLFDGPCLGDLQGLFQPGKDDKTKKIDKKRVRIDLNVIAGIEEWRCAQIQFQGDGHRIVSRWGHPIDISAADSQ